VRDNGIGIDVAHRPGLFELFHRLHGRKDNPGSGMSLATCRKIVEGQGGRLWVESEPGAGATFRFTMADALAEVGP